MAAALPPNIQEFNEIAGIIFAQLYASHPVPRDLGRVLINAQIAAPFARAV
jgi:hypothetical protein